MYTYVIMDRQMFCKLTYISLSMLLSATIFKSFIRRFWELCETKSYLRKQKENPKTNKPFTWNKRLVFIFFYFLCKFSGMRSIIPAANAFSKRVLMALFPCWPKLELYSFT